MYEWNHYNLCHTTDSMTLLHTNIREEQRTSPYHFRLHKFFFIYYTLTQQKQKTYCSIDAVIVSKTATDLDCYAVLLQRT